MKHVTRRVFGALLVLGASLTPALALDTQPPTACFTVAPPSALTGAFFNVNASCSSDNKTPLAALRVRWDWEIDGVLWDTALSTTKTASHAYSTEGHKTITVEVRDQAGNTATFSRTVDVLRLVSSMVAEPSFPPGATEPDVDVNPTDGQNVVVSAFTTGGNGGTGPLGAFTSSDGGQTSAWTQATGPGFSPGDPGIEFDSTGQVLRMILDDTIGDGSPQGVVVAHSTDDGVTYPTWEYGISDTTSFLFPDGTPHTPWVSGNNLRFDYPEMAVDKNGTSPRVNNIYLLARSPFDVDGNGYADTNADVFARWDAQAGEWGAAKAFPDMVGWTSAIGIGADGAVYLASDVGDTAVCSTGNGILLRKSTDGGATFGAPSCLYNSNGSISPVRPWIAAHPTDPSKVYVVFDGVLAPSNALHVYVVTSNNGGLTWGNNAIRVDEVIGDDVVDHKHPALSVAAGGRLDVVWFDYRLSTPKLQQQPLQPGDVFYAFSMDGGTTWSPNVRLTTQTRPLYYGAGNDFLSVVSTPSAAWAVYAQDEDSDTLYETWLKKLLF